ncbi:hypothetical protein KIF59_16465 [Enterobacter cloacae subsp. cloacae]|nr:hypothetical protein [Enterobacter cloacae subsp. cloacae]
MRNQAAGSPKAPAPPAPRRALRLHQFISVALLSPLGQRTHTCVTGGDGLFTPFHPRWLNAPAHRPVSPESPARQAVVFDLLNQFPPASARLMQVDFGSPARLVAPPAW